MWHKQSAPCTTKVAPLLPGRLFERNAWIVNSVDRSPGHGASEEAQARVRVVAAIERRCGSFPHMHVSDVGYR